MRSWKWKESFVVDIVACIECIEWCTWLNSKNISNNMASKKWFQRRRSLAAAS